MIAGIDVSSHTVDLVLLDDDTDTATWHPFPLAGATPFERARNCRLVLPGRSWWEDKGVWLIGIEDPHSRFPHVAKALGLITGAVAALLPSQLTVIQTAPKEWKRLTTGNANAPKEAVAAWAAGFGFEPGNLNATDAYAIARAVRLLNNEAIETGAA